MGGRLAAPGRALSGASDGAAHHRRPSRFCLGREPAGQVQAARDQYPERNFGCRDRAHRRTRHEARTMRELFRHHRTYGPGACRRPVARGRGRSVVDRRGCRVSEHELRQPHGLAPAHGVHQSSLRAATGRRQSQKQDSEFADRVYGARGSARRQEDRLDLQHRAGQHQRIARPQSGVPVGCDYGQHRQSAVY